MSKLLTIAALGIALALVVTTVIGVSGGLAFAEGGPRGNNNNHHHPPQATPDTIFPLDETGQHVEHLDDNGQHVKP
jgi:hypothetical protein